MENGWLVVLGLNTTLTAKVISWWSVTHTCFLAFLMPVLTQLSFQSHQLLFLHASAEVRGKNYLERKFVSNSQPPGYESAKLTTESPGQGSDGKCLTLPHNRDLTTLGKKPVENIVVTSIFSFSVNVFFSSGKNKF